MKANDIKKIKKEIAKLRSIAQKHRAVVRSASDDADNLEKPLILAETKEKFEGKYFQNTDPRWEEYIFCEKITGYEKISGGEISPTGIFLFIGKNKMDKDEVSISRRIVDYAGAYCKNEISGKTYMSKVAAILKSLKLNEYRIKR